MRLCELQEKKVINICDCCCLGCVVDLELNPLTGCIKAIFVSGPGRFFGCFCKDGEFRIPWCDIIRIGPDIILVTVKEKNGKT